MSAFASEPETSPSCLGRFLTFCVQKRFDVLLPVFPEADLCWRTVTRGHLPGRASLLPPHTAPLTVSPHTCLIEPSCSFFFFFFLGIYSSPPSQRPGDSRTVRFLPSAYLLLFVYRVIYSRFKEINLYLILILVHRSVTKGNAVCASVHLQPVRAGLQYF